MAIKIIHDYCPTCKTKIGLRLMCVNGEILRCPKCGALLIDDPKRNLYGALLFAAGFLLIEGLRHSFGSNIFRDVAILVVSGFLYGTVRKLTIIKKDLVIRNKQSNQISYIDRAEWNEILDNNKDKDNTFEIIEEL